MPAGLVVMALLVSACGGAPAKGAAAPGAAPTPGSDAAAAAATPARREYAATTLPSGDGPVPANQWEKGRPSWLDGELIPKRATPNESIAWKDVDAARELTKEKEVFERTRAVASADRFAWGAHVCTAPSYEQRVITLDTRLAEENRPSSEKKHNHLFWEVRVTCAPGKGDVGLAIYRVIREGGKLDEMIVGNTPKMHFELKPKREVREEVALPQPEPGGTLTTGEGPLPTRDWTPGRPAWFDGELKTNTVLVIKDDELENKSRMRERDALFKEKLAISDKRISYAGRLCTEPAYEQRLVPKETWLHERHIGGGIIKGEEVWAVRIRCAKGKGDFNAEVGRSIVRGKLKEYVHGTLFDFDISWDVPAK